MSIQVANCRIGQKGFHTVFYQFQMPLEEDVSEKICIALWIDIGKNKEGVFFKSFDGFFSQKVYIHHNLAGGILIKFTVLVS